MFILTLPQRNHIFYSAGKVATQTLLSIEYKTNLLRRGQTMPLLDTVDLRKECLVQMKFLMMRDSSNVSVIIRNPKDRFYSGLYEIIAKKIYGSNIEHACLEGLSATSAKELIELMYNTNYWSNCLDDALRHRPAQWISSQGLGSQRWQYHVGNWLSDVYEVLDYARLFERNIKIVDVNSLSQHLNDLHLAFEIKNEKSSMMRKLGTMSQEYKELHASIDHKKIQTAFMSALSSVDSSILDSFDQYIKPEQEIYNNLLEMI